MTLPFSIFNLSKRFIRFCAYLNVFYTELCWLTCIIPVILLWSYVKTGKKLLLLNLESQNNLCWNASLEFSSQPPARSRANAWSNAAGLLLRALPSQSLEITKDGDPGVAVGTCSATSPFHYEIYFLQSFSWLDPNLSISIILQAPTSSLAKQMSQFVSNSGSCF